MWNWIKNWFKSWYELQTPLEIDGTESKGWNYTQKDGVITFHGSGPEYESIINSLRNSPWNKANHKQPSLLSELEAIKERKHLKYNEALALTIAIKSLKEEQDRHGSRRNN